MEERKNKIIHLAIIVLGIVFISIGAFHQNLWFDETYSVALAKHSFADIWRIGGNDVHPILYYMFLKIINILSGGSIIAYRLFSALAISILGILGFTHIRKDFGSKIGILFTFFTFFLPVITPYASEIRMYSWAALFVTLTAIYGYRLTKKSNIKNWILFGLFSILSLYTHYYGVMAAGLINIAVLIYFIRRSEKQNIIKFLVTGIAQVILYAPWLYCFIIQLTNVSKGFWITLSFPGTLFEIMDFQCLGNLDERVAIVLSFALFIIGFFVMNSLKTDKKTKNKINIKSLFKNTTGKEFDPGKQAIILYFGVIIAAAILSIKTPILYPRYLFVITGLLIFFWSYFISKCNSKKILGTIIVFVVLVSIYSNVKFIRTNYDNSNMTQIEYIKNNLKSEDVIIFNNPELGSGSVIDVNIDGNITYFYDSENWNVEKAYEAYAPDMKIIHNLDELTNFKGRIWIIDSNDNSLYNEISEKFSIEEIERKTINTKYKGYNFNFILVNK